MARDPLIEERLRRWADAVKVGDGSGFPSVNILHPNWSPPSPGMRPAMKAAKGGAEIGQTHLAIGMLSVKLRNAVVVHYCFGGPLAEQAVRLECAVSTVLSRVEMAHAELMQVLH